MNKIELFFKWAEKNKWEIKKNGKENNISLSENIKKRYSNIPEEFIKFLSMIENCISPDEKTWFICLKEYNENSEFAFSWDEIEKMSLIEDDDEFNSEVKIFWDEHFPIMLSVKNGYKYYAIDIKNNYGVIVSGEEPEFEDYEIVASSFIEFLEMIVKNEIQI